MEAISLQAYSLELPESLFSPEPATVAGPLNSVIGDGSPTASTQSTPQLKPTGVSSSSSVVSSVTAGCAAALDGEEDSSDDSDDDEEDIDEAEPNHGDLQNGIPIDDDNQPEDFDHMNGNNIENAENGEVIQEIQNGEVNQMVEGLANNNIELIDSQMSNNGNQVAYPQLPVDLSEQIE